jgi:hypothetical protein
LIGFKKDLLESDAITLPANLRGVLARLASRFSAQGGNDA